MFKVSIIKNLILSNKLFLSILIILISGFTLITFLKQNEHRFQLIDGDGSGYYSWLPTILNQHSLDFSKTFEFEKQRHGSDYTGHNYHQVNGITINKFPPGTALFISPFFGIAYLINGSIGDYQDFFNPIFQIAVALAAIFWASIGLLFFYRLLLTYKNTHTNALIIVLSVLFAGNLLPYIYLMPSFSHIYSFASISILLFYSRIFFINNKLKPAIIAAIFLAFTISIRPVNLIVIVFLPFLADNYKSLIQSFKSKLSRGRIFIIMAVFLIAISPVLLINYIQTGYLFYNSYTNEGFYWSKPEILNFLFSFRKGWFIYSPFFLLIIPSIIFLFQQNKYRFVWFGLFAIINIYLFSSWWNWFYGDSFGMRPMVEMAGIYSIPIFLFYNKLNTKIKTITLIFIFLCGLLNIIQSYQYAKGIIHPDSMNKEAYFKVFLKTSDKYSGIIGGDAEYYYGHLETQPFLHKEFNFNLLKFENQQTTSNESLRFNDNRLYGPAFQWQIPDSLTGHKNLYVSIKSKFKESNEFSVDKVLYIMDIQDTQNNTSFYKKAKLERIPNDNTKEFKQSSTGFKLPLLNDSHNHLIIYIWNIDKQDFEINDFEISFFTYKN